MFEVGQTVWDVVRGEGVVDAIESETPYPLIVRFAGGGGDTYMTNGKSHVNNKNSSLYPYPVEVAKKVVRPVIDWSHVHSKYRWLAKDPSGSYWLYEKQPYETDCGWKSENGDYTCADGFATLSPGFCDWEDSLIVGPGGV